MSLLGVLVGLIVVGVLLWAINAVLRVIPIPEPFKTICWVLIVVISVFVFLDISGLYAFNSVRLR